jgi:ketosteroid isomerase-like protein
MAEHQNAQLIRKGYEAFAAGDMATLSELFAKDILWHEAGTAATPLSGDYKGQDAVFGLFGELIQQTTEFSVRLEEIVADDHQAVAIHETYARRGSTTYRCREAIVFHLLEGKVTDAWHTVPDTEAYELFWQAPAEMTTAEQNAATCRRGYKAFGEGDLATLTEIFDDAIVWHVKDGGPLDGDYAGRDAVFGYFAQLAQEMDGTLKLDLHDVLANDEHVIALVNATGTRKGKTTTTQFAQVFHMRAGKVTECFVASTDPMQSIEFWKD